MNMKMADDSFGSRVKQREDIFESDSNLYPARGSLGKRSFAFHAYTMSNPIAAF
jgi:hypothetical protein